MTKSKKEESKQQKKGVEIFMALSKSELYFIRGGDMKNSEKDDGEQ